MLEQMRNAAKGWVAKVLLSLLVLSFGVWGITDVFRGFVNQDLAQVGDQTISSKTYQDNLNRTLQALGRQTGTPMTLEDARKAGVDKDVLDQMIASAALDAQRDRLKLGMGQQAVIDAVQANPVFHGPDGKFDVNRFNSILRQNGLTEPVFLASEKGTRLREALANVASDQMTLPRTLTEALSQYRDETRDARYVSFSVSAADVPAPSDDDLKKQYDSNPVAYTAPEYRSIAVLKVEPADIAAKVSVTDDELAAFYEQAKQDYFKPETRTIVQLSLPDVATAEQVKARLDKGDDILKIAAERGLKEEDITFKDKLKSDFLDPAIADAAFSLAEGAVSKPVKGSLNTAILKAVKVTPEHQSTLDEVKEQIRSRVQLDKAREEIQSVYDAVEDGRAQQSKFEDIASKTGIPLTVVPAVSAAGQDKAGADVVLPHKDEVLKAAFSSDVGVENDALSVGDGYIWYDVREVVPSALRPLSEIKDVVKADWSAGRLRQAASDKAKAILAKAGTVTKLETIATELNGTIKTASNVKRNETTAEFDGPATLALFSAPEKTLTWSLEGDGKSARIIEVSKVTVPAFEAGSAAAKQLADSLLPSLQADLTATQLKAVKAETKVTINDSLWATIRGDAPASQ